MTLYAASRPRALALQHALLASAIVSRGALVPGARKPEVWSPPLGDQQWAGLLAAWAELTTAPVDGIAVYRRVQAERGGLTLLVCAGRRSVLVRLSTDAAAFDLEWRVSAAAEQMRPRSFHVPRFLGAGHAEGWRWVAYEAISHRPHLPARAATQQLAAEISQLVEAVGERPAGTPGHWLPAHRDLTPWNLRRARGALWLIDWEDSGWAPPQADLVYFAATRNALRAGPVAVPDWTAETDEARAYWTRLVAARTPAAAEARLAERTLAALASPGAA